MGWGGSGGGGGWSCGDDDPCLRPEVLCTSDPKCREVLASRRAKIMRRSKTLTMLVLNRELLPSVLPSVYSVRGTNVSTQSAANLLK